MTRSRRVDPQTHVADVEVMPHLTLDNVPTAALMIDTFGRVLHSNHKASLLLERHGAQLRGMTILTLLGRDVMWNSGDASALATTIVLSLPSGRSLNVIASTSTVVESTGCTRTIVALTPLRGHAEHTLDTVPRITRWAEISEQVAAFETETLCIAVGVTGLQGINADFSRSTGDVVIAAIGRRLVSASPVGAVIERTGGDRFVVVAPVSGDDRRAVNELLRALRLPIETPLGDAAVGCAAGVSTGPSRPPLVLLDRADRNLRAALARGPGTVEWGDRARTLAPSTKARLGAPLLAGLAKRSISAHFQPVVDLTNGNVVEYEAMARWQDDSGQHHHAAQFIGAAKDTGSIGELGIQVLQAALDLAVVLDGTGPPCAARVSVNVSTAELTDLALADRVIAMLAESEVAPATLQLEIVDAVGAAQMEYARLNVARMRQAGIRFALDGFGSRSANLLSLVDIDIDAVKLDPAMTRDAISDPRSLNLLRSVVALAGQIGLEVVAKGVETLEQHEMLVRLGCRYGQGFLYSPPRAMSELDLGSPLLAIGVGTSSSEERRRARATALATNGSLDAADLSTLIRSAAQRNGADMAAVAVIEPGVRWVAWEMNDRWDRDPPELEGLVRSACTSGLIEIDDTVQFEATPAPVGSTVMVRSLSATPITTSDNTAIGALCLLWLDPMRPGKRDADELLRCADHISARIELADTRA